MAIELSHQRFRTAVGDVSAGAGSLRSDRDRIDRQVDGFLAGGWSGVAADAFAQAWGDWRDASQDVLAGLVAMGQLLDAVHRDFVERDAGSEAALDLVAQRILGRLG